VTTADNAAGYSVKVSNAQGSVVSPQGMVTIQAVDPIPVITTQPVNGSASYGSYATFTAGATGTGVSYQWQLLTNGRWVDVTGANAISLMALASLATDQAQYRLVASSTGGSVTSSVVTLTARRTVISRPAILAAGYRHTVMSLPNMAPRTCGYNSSGQLGDNTTVDKSTPVAPTTGYESYYAVFWGVGAGYDHSVFSFKWNLGADFATSWGGNNFGQLGANNLINQLNPQIATVGPNVSSGRHAIAAGNSWSMAMKDGLVYTTGYNYWGQLGQAGADVKVWNASPIAGLSDVSAIAAGDSFGLALTSTGVPYSWGADYYGGLGRGCLYATPTPGAVSGLTNVVAIAAGGWHSVFLKDDGTVWTAGSNGNGQLGQPNNGCEPRRVPSLGPAVAIAAGNSHTYALLADGTVWAWGDNSYGQLGDGTRASRSTPVRVLGLNNATDLPAGGMGLHSLAVTADGNVWSWGNNDHGQLCLGSGAPSAVGTPTQVPGINLGVRFKP
jgi:alpha-tubulin suppressor-like RCC1 family protein